MRGKINVFYKLTCNLIWQAQSCKTSFKYKKECCFHIVEVALFVGKYTTFMNENDVNIFRKYNYCVTHYTSTYYKTYCFAFQKWLFCTVKA